MRFTLPILIVLAAPLYSAGRISYSITGNGDIGGFMPTQIPGCKVWVSANRGTYGDSAKTVSVSSNTAPIGAWADLTGNGIDFLQATATRRPTLTLSGPNGRPYLSSSSNNGYIKTGTISIAEPVTIFVVTTQATLSQGSVLEYGISTFNANATPKWQFGNGGAPLVGVAATIGWHYHTLVGIAGTSRIRTDGVETTGTTSGGTMTVMSMMASSNGFSALSANSGIAEFILYTRALTGGQVLVVEKYLKAKYGL